LSGHPSSTIEILKTVGDLNRKKIQIIESWLKKYNRNWSKKEQLRLHKFGKFIEGFPKQFEKIS
jgi:hypothetical protein